MTNPITAYIRTTPLAAKWYIWRSYRFPWRKRYFVGMDLNQNTFWEFRDRINASRPRRTVVFKDKSRDWVDYAGDVSPQWHQWLRALRTEAPTIAEQENELLRRQQLRAAAALADARWASKPSLLDAAPHPPQDSVLEKNTKSSKDSGLQHMQDVGRGAVGNGRGAGKETFERERMERANEEGAEFPNGKGKAMDEVEPVVETWTGGKPSRVRGAMNR